MVLESMSSLPARASRKAPPGGFSPLVMIPSRLGSSRLPGKPLASIAGEPMIVHVWRSAVEAACLAGGAKVAVAVDDPAILDAVESAGGTGVLTRKEHVSGTDRIFEALQCIDPRGHHDVVVNLQGDMPDFPSRGLAIVLEALARDHGSVIGTLAGRLRGPGEAADRHVVKAVLGEIQSGIARALDFTREPAPWPEREGEHGFFHHVGVYAYRREALARFVALPPSPRELGERLEQLRALEDGMQICAGMLEEVPVGVDTPEDLERVRSLFLARFP